MRKLLTPIFLLALSATGFAQTVNVAWDAHSQAAQLSGFTLYETKQSPVCPNGSPPTFGFVAYDQAGGTSTTMSITTLQLGRIYWALTANATDGTKSDCSNEVTTVIKPKPPKLNSVIQAMLQVPAKAIKWALGIKSKGLRIVRG